MGRPWRRIDAGGSDTSSTFAFTTTTFTYDAIGRETSRATTAGATNRMTHAATYNRAGHILSATETVTTGSPAVTTYAYDAAGRLTGYTPPAGSAVTYGWDEVPNRTSVTTGGTPTTTTYDAANRPISAGFGSDADGRLTARPTAGGQSFVWDDLGRPTQVKNAAGTVTLATYTYDPLDRLRLVDRGSTDQVRFRYVGTTTAAAQVLDHDAGTVSRNVATSWDGTRLADWTGAGTDLRIYGTNAHHDVTFTTGTAGTVTANARYDPWGTLAASSGTLPDFGFQGSWTDATTQLAWVITRWYAPAQGRFLSEDSLLGEPARPASRHLYAYGEGEPVGRWDPDGRAPTGVDILRWLARHMTAVTLAQRQIATSGNARDGRFWVDPGEILAVAFTGPTAHHGRPDIVLLHESGRVAWVWEVKHASPGARGAAAEQLERYINGTDGRGGLSRDVRLTGAAIRHGFWRAQIEANVPILRETISVSFVRNDGIVLYSFRPTARAQSRYSEAPDLPSWLVRLLAAAAAEGWRNVPRTTSPRIPPLVWRWGLKGSSGLSVTPIRALQ